MKTNTSARTHGAVSLPATVALCGVIGLFAGCATEPNSVLVSSPPPPPPTSAQPATVYSSPAPAVASPVGGSSIVVMQAPPAVQQEVPPPRPSSDHVWVAGYWTWSNNQYVWQAGRWDVPPRAGAVWVPPRWQQEGTSWRFYEGYWN